MLPRSGKEGIKDRQGDHKALLPPPPDAANTSPFAATAGHGAAMREELHEGDDFARNGAAFHASYPADGGALHGG